MSTNDYDKRNVSSSEADHDPGYKQITIGRHSIRIKGDLSDHVPDDISQLEAFPKSCSSMSIKWSYKKSDYQISINTANYQTDLPGSQIGVKLILGLSDSNTMQVSVGTSLTAISSHAVLNLLEQLTKWFDENPEHMNDLHSGVKELTLTNLDLPMGEKINTTTVRELGGEILMALYRPPSTLTDAIGQLSTEQANAIVDLAMAIIARHTGDTIENDDDFPVVPLPKNR